MNIILIGLFIIALGCTVFVNMATLIDKLNEEDDSVYRAPFDIGNPFKSFYDNFYTDNDD